MATFNYTVDTQPMAEEIRGVAREVNVTTGAVVAMQAAVIAAETKAADHICSNVNRGFYSLIRSQISQKIARLQSEVDSHLMQLNQQSKAVLSIKTRMQRDYHMISARYTKLFTGLNNNLKTRVAELDRPAMDFVYKDINALSNRSKYLTAAVPVTQLESLSESQKIIASNVKHKGFQVIESMKRFIHEMNLQKVVTDQILISNMGNLMPGNIYVPIVMIENNQDNSTQRNVEFSLPPIDLDNITRSVINNLVYDNFDKLDWSHADQDTTVLNNEFIKLMQNSNSGGRVKATAQKLYEAGKFQSL